MIYTRLERLPAQPFPLPKRIIGKLYRKCRKVGFFPGAEDIIELHQFAEKYFP